MAGTDKDLAVSLVAEQQRIGGSTVYSWFGRVRGVERADWLPFLADLYCGRTATVEMSDEAWEYFKADYLTQSKPAMAASHYRTLDAGKAHGWIVPALSTFKRRLARDVPHEVIVLKREGSEAHARLFPAQRRDRSSLHALEAVNWDGHMFDVFVAWPGIDRPVRPMLSAFQDLYSGKLLSWRLDISENTNMFRLAFGDMVDTYGIPEIAVIDNTRTAANKQMTGQTPTRFRFKIKDDDPAGLFTILGVKVHWTQPYHGQSKPIERMFRDLCEEISKSPDCAGAYCGNKPGARPEDCKRTIPLEEFLKIVDRGVRNHNAQLGRTSKVCGGIKSFDQAFAESYATAPIRKEKRSTSSSSSTSKRMRG